MLCDGIWAHSFTRAARGVRSAAYLCYNSVAPRGTASKLRALHTNASDLRQPAGCRSWRRMGAWPPALARRGRALHSVLCLRLLGCASEACLFKLATRATHPTEYGASAAR